MIVDYSLSLVILNLGNGWQEELVIEIIVYAFQRDLFFVDKFQLLIDKTTSPHFTWLLQLFFVFLSETIEFLRFVSN